MRQTFYAFLLGLLIFSLVGCSKSGDDNVTPANTSDLLVRQWNFSTITVKTEAKSYVIPPSTAVLSDNNVITFAKGGTFSYLENGATVSGKWTLVNDKTLTLIDAYNETTIWTVNTISNTNLELASATVDVTKGDDFSNTKIYSAQEQNIAVSSFLLISSMDKSNGGTLDISQEPKPKSVQLILNGKAQ